MINTEILLESGTNEIEIMEFTVYGESYGINVAKVREILMSDRVKPVPHAHKAIEGIFKPRDTMLTVVDLPYYLTDKKTEYQEKDLFVITNFNLMNIAFRVHSVVGIHRISWTAIEKPDKAINGGEDGVATGIAQCADKLITILDFEKIVSDISPQTGIQLDEVKPRQLGSRGNCRLMLAEDSILLTHMIHVSLAKAGYTNVTEYNNGQEAWDYLCTQKSGGVADGEIDLIITDIEMPQMDGHRLTKLVKTDRELQHIPIVIFSSLISPEMEIKGKQLGADAQLSKPEIGHLVGVIDHLLEKGGK